ncbi:histone-lysine N-methyltransferase eggless isoform X2 [Agrilus planipennis]|uniref:Histone-lysine N-methyltransferase eggless isoform X2 n=1 Tax=Agrilus planipennis TaxID=224129 RepID=A0A7F5RDY0_AGRPL|nr:histone-lysine N-methyltransferase eggless isoform X2 [Agrilus planipennis]
MNQLIFINKNFNSRNLTSFEENSICEKTKMDIEEPMEIDDTVPNTVIIENKRMSTDLLPPNDSLSNNEHQKTDIENSNCIKTDKSQEGAANEDMLKNPSCLSDDDLEVIEVPSKNLTKSVPDEPETSSENKEKRKEDDCVVILTDDEDEHTTTDTSRRKRDLVATEVIDLVPQKKNSVNNKCINYACQSGFGMIKAPIFCLSYFRVKNAENKCLEVCQECFEEAFLHYDGLSTALMGGKLLVEQEVPVRDDMFEIDDSDSEEDAEKEVAEYFDNESVEFLKENLDMVIMETIEKYKLNEQVNNSVKYLVEKEDKLKESCIQVDGMIKDLRKCLDGIQRNIYSEFRVRYQHLPSLELCDRPSQTGRRSELNRKRSASCFEMDTDKHQITSEMDKIDDVVEVPADLPPKGEIIKPEPVIGQDYYSARYLTMGSWMPVKLEKVLDSGEMINGRLTSNHVYSVLVNNKQKTSSSSRLHSGREMAYFTAPNVQLDVGTRVIAVFRETATNMETKKHKKETFFPGIVAEPLSAANRYRYLIFFDDGYAQYVNHNQVRLVFESSKFVWEDVHIDSRPFIKKYLESYPDRPMVKLRKDQTVRTEYRGKWWLTTVMKIDCSLVQMFFDASNRVEWIYRGSTRLNPMFKEEQAASNRLQNKARIMPRMQRGTDNSGAYVEYTRNDEQKDKELPSEATVAPVKAVARKSTAKAMLNAVTKPSPFVGAVPFLPVVNKEKETLSPATPPTKVVYFTPRAQTNLRAPYKCHVCSPRCKRYVLHNVNKLNSYNPLAKPLLCGWNRLTLKHKGKREINYKAPCGRFIRTMAELHLYLRLTESEMTVDLFDFDYWVHCLAEFMLEKDATINKDLSNALENVPIPVVNYNDNEMNDFCNYSTKREPMDGVNLNLDPEFLCGCDCEDDCTDKMKCQCWQLTLEGMSYLQKNISPDQVGYQYRRLPEAVPTGIYECNSRCKCAPTCLNRVVQNPLQLKLQVFKTTNRGWGIRCLNDIPQGAFICIYAGSLLTEQMANEGGKNYGDEYLAELDYIEVVEKMKEDYEEEAVLDEEDLKKPKSRENSDNEDDEKEQSTTGRGRKKNYTEDTDFVLNVNFNANDSSIRSRLRRRHTEEEPKTEVKENDTKKKEATEKKEEKKDKAEPEEDYVMISDDEDCVHEPSSFNPKDESKLDETRPMKYMSVRELYAEDECVYVMDAKVSGNIGRFLNHSCSPNVFVQNVFVDTHDLRFPWVAFFALTYIRAGTELTWNYNYDVGSVPGKTMYCYCASDECRGRLL